MIILCKYVATFSFSRLVIDLRLSTPPKTYLLKFIFFKTCTKGQSFRSNFEITLFLVLFTEYTKSFSFTLWPEAIGIKVHKVNSVQEACAKCFAVQLLKFKIL